jgi:hypothetical protein
MDNHTKIFRDLNNDWISYLDNKIYGAGCSGLDDCDFCLKAMYKVRTTYARKWFYYFIKYFDDFKDGNYPNFYWHASPTAKQFDVDDFITQHTNIDDIFVCFLKKIYMRGVSLDMIFGHYRSVRV